MLKITYTILHHKTAPKEFRCSKCGGEVERGKLYVKTNWGRYCLGCSASLGNAE